MLMQPMLHRLLQHYPSAQIDVLAPPWTEKLLQHMPEVHDIIVNPFPHGEFAFAARRRLGAAARGAARPEEGRVPVGDVALRVRAGDGCVTRTWAPA